MMTTPAFRFLGRLALCGTVAVLSAVTTAAQFFGPQTRTEIRVVVDLTPDGRKLPEPSPTRPVIYFPVTAPEPEADEGVPDRKAVHRWLIQALAAQGYLPVNPQQDRPSQLLVFQWGELDPQIEEMETRVDDDNPVMGQKFWNEREFLDLIAGRSSDKPMPWWKRENLRREAVVSRHFVRLVAFDYEAAKKKEQKVLWHARVSTHADGVTLKEVLPALIRAGGPHFGRATKQPVVVTVPFVRDGNVELGDPTVEGYLPPTGEPTK